MKRIKILARRNLKMTPGKLAAQAVHAALGLSFIHGRIEPMASVVVLDVSDAKFEEAINLHNIKSLNSEAYLVRDAGYTEVKAGSETCLAFFEDDPRLQESKEVGTKTEEENE